MNNTIKQLDLEEYTLLYHIEHGGITVLRYGEPWCNETGDKLIMAMFNRIQELQDNLDELVGSVYEHVHDTIETYNIAERIDSEDDK